jgi:hypothetical protein
MPRPREFPQPLDLDRLEAQFADPVRPLFDPLERIVDLAQQAGGTTLSR